MHATSETAFDYGAVLQSVARRRPEALHTLYEQEAPRLLGIAVRVLRDREAAEDVVHEVFVQLWRDAAGFDPSRGSARAWLGTIVRNRAINLLRRQSRQVDLDEVSLERVVDEAESPDAALMRLQDTEALKHCLQSLEPTRRACIVHAYLDGFSQSEIAERLNVPLNTVKSWIRRGLLTLRDCLR